MLAQNYDVYCGIQDVEYFDVSCFCGEELTPNFLFGSSVVDGFIDNLNYDVYCGTLYSNVIDFDVWILSLKLENIVPRQGDYLSVEGAICVDVVDDIYDVVTSGTYFLVNDTQVSGTFTAITDGYTMCYNPTDNFSDVDGPVEITVHAENTNGDKLEQSFYLTSGYLVEYKNAFYLGPGRRVYIRLSAENYASCPSLGAVGYWFETADTIPKDLAATIIGVRDIEQNDLTATIYPNSTAYFYGKKFTVELRARDYAGNEMKPHIFEFKIEDKIEES